MHVGFVSAIFPDQSLEEVVRFAAEAGFRSVELMAWPSGGGEARRYAGVTHLDAETLDDATARSVRDLFDRAGVAISGLGYYPNPLAADPEEARVALAHLHRLIDAAGKLGVGVLNSFVGRDPAKTVEANWPAFLETWRPIVAHAEERGVTIGIENCPMLFTADEWPGGKNLATTPAIWRKMFEAIPSRSFGLNYDPSHLIWQGMDPIAPIAEFADRLVHVHAKDARVDLEARDDHGVLSYPNLWHTPKLPGQGDLDWGRFVGALNDAGYAGAVAIEVEDRAFETTLARRREALVISRRFLRQYLVH